ncbi:MAG TPA: hypothetical protein VMB25_25130 [Bryobacteraceae bacterium]|nr:hypothetical protein [Bryobacteraceae bacterium]
MLILLAPSERLADCTALESVTKAMKTVQIALRDPDYAQSLRNLLLRDGNHRVYVVEQADLRLDGVVVTDAVSQDNLSVLEKAPERFVVLTRKGSDHLSMIWDAGVRHVVFDGDSPNTTQLAVIAAELRLPDYGLKGGRNKGPEKHHTSPQPTLPVLETPRRSARSRFGTTRDFGF